MDIDTLAGDLKKLVLQSAELLNLEPVDTFLNRNVKLESDNQFNYSHIGPVSLYLIAHKDVRVVYDFLKLSPETLQNIVNTRTLISNIDPEEMVIPHVLHKVKIKPEEIEFSIIGSGLSSFRIVINNSHLYVTVADQKFKSELHLIDCYDDIDSLVNMATHQVIPSFLNYNGFKSTDQNSPEVVDFIKKTADEMFVEKGVNPLFNYLQPIELVHLVCTDLKLNVNVVLKALNAKNNDTFSNLHIPNNLTTMMSSMAQHIVKKDGIKSKIDQLISLIVLYNLITHKKTKFSVSFTPVKKRDFFKGQSSDRSFYRLNISDTLIIKIGHNIMPNAKDDAVYVQPNDDNKFFSFIYLKNIDTYEYKEYVTNDIDYVYNEILTDLCNIVKIVLHKDDDELISFKDLEVYNMAVF